MACGKGLLESILMDIYISEIGYRWFIRQFVTNVWTTATFTHHPKDQGPYLLTWINFNLSMDM